MRLSCAMVEKAILTLKYVISTNFTLSTDFSTLPQVGITPICHKALAVHCHLLDSPYTITSCSTFYFSFLSWTDCSVFPHGLPIPFITMHTAFGNPWFPTRKKKSRWNKLGCYDVQDFFSSVPSCHLVWLTPLTDVHMEKHTFCFWPASFSCSWFWCASWHIS